MKCLRLFSFRWKSLNQTKILHFYAKFDLKAWHDKKNLNYFEIKKNENWCKIRWQIVFMIFVLFVFDIFSGFWQYLLLLNILEYVYENGFICFKTFNCHIFLRSVYVSVFLLFFTLDKSICICWFEFIYLIKITLSNKVVCDYVEGIAISSFFYLKKIRSNYC